MMYQSLSLVDLPQDLAPIGPVPLIENGIHNERQ